MNGDVAMFFSPLVGAPVDFGGDQGSFLSNFGGGIDVANGDVAAFFSPDVPADFGAVHGDFLSTGGGGGKGEANGGVFTGILLSVAVSSLLTLAGDQGAFISDFSPVGRVEPNGIVLAAVVLCSAFP